MAVLLSLGESAGFQTGVAVSGTKEARNDKAPDFSLPEVGGKTQSLSALSGKKAVVLVFMGIQCPRARAAEPRLCDLAREYGEKGVAFYAINSNRHESVEEIADHAKKSGFTIPVLKDARNKIADLYKVETEPTAFVLDAELRIRYRGLIDDHKLEEFVRNHHLRNAIEAVLAGKDPEVAATEPQGCYIKKEETVAPSKEVTYTKHVAPILNRHCAGCHRPGQVGPFPLEDYEQASAWTKEIARAARTRAMPPWKPVSNHGLYYNERRLTDEEVALLERWNKAGSPEGDAKDLPPLPKYSDEWMLGKPDAVLKVDVQFELGPRGPDEYRCYVIKNPFPEDKWVTAVEYRAGNMRSVHHIIAYLDLNGASERKDAGDAGPGYKSNGAGPNILPSGTLGGWAPGNLPRMLPKGVGRLLRKGERIVLETHYHKTGRPEVDRGHEIALYFSKEPVERQLQIMMIANPLIRIPAGASAHKVRAFPWTIQSDIEALDVMPHMHLLGREMSVVATLPDGTKQDLVVVKDWDFNWQETYQFKEPLRLPKGTVVRMEAVYDNSAGNPNNPSNPPRVVTWGEETTDEMCIAFVSFITESGEILPRRGRR